MIKNKIFEELREGVHAAFAEERWEELKNILNSGPETIGLATFFRHYWISKYTKCNASELYDNFMKKIPKKVDSYKQLLEDLCSNARNYMKILNPKREDYGNRKEYYWLIQSLEVMNKTFGVIQTRIALLALFDAKDRDIVSLNQFKKAILAMENFHFAFTALCSQRTNNLESLYSRFARAIRKCNNKSDSDIVIRKNLIEPLEKLYPKYDMFVSKFKELIFAKNDNPMNLKTKYAIYKLNSYFGGKEIFEDDGSIEHILPETDGEHALNIGNLILLEVRINGDAGNKEYLQKLDFYKKSNYVWIKKFVSNYAEWNGAEISSRADKLAILYYNAVLERQLPTKNDIQIENIV